MKEALAEVGDFKIGRSDINKVKFADYMAIIAKSQVELHDMEKRLVDTGRKYCKEIDIEQLQVKKISRSNEPLQIKVNNRELKGIVIILNIFEVC